MKKISLADLLRKVHEDEGGTVTAETILVIAAVALPLLIILIKYGIPWVNGLFNRGKDMVDEGVDALPH